MDNDNFIKLFVKVKTVIGSSKYFLNIGHSEPKIFQILVKKSSEFRKLMVCAGLDVGTIGFVNMKASTLTITLRNSIDNMKTNL